MIEAQTEWLEDDATGIFVILWSWHHNPGGGLVEWYVGRAAAEAALAVLKAHGDHEKSFKLESL